ncbi:MAG: hypothetical protein SVQ76_02685 [Candidatus Nanohaloarchaea archaeon]|nr:hypothetical protein [Candidatus Nanohaloarchaea archaeon]
MTGYRAASDAYTPEEFAAEAMSVVETAERRGYEVYGAFPDSLSDFLTGEGGLHGLDQVRDGLEEGFDGSAIVLFYPEGEEPEDSLEPSNAVGRLLYNRDNHYTIIHLEEGFPALE